MKKQLVYFFAIMFALIQASYCYSSAASSSSPIKIAVKKYKAGNYTGCLQDCQNIVAKNPSSSIAYYYMAMSYVQAGQKDKAINAYSKVLSLNPNATLAEYATTGKRCLETPEQCVLTDPNAASTQDIDKLIASPNSDGLSPTVKKDFEQKRLNTIKNEINNDKDMDDYQLRKLNDASEKVMPDKANAVASKQPTNDDIAAALKVLSNAGLNTYGQYSDYQNNNNNAMMNMLPLMMTQNGGGMNSNYSPQAMQAFIMNSMMSNMNFDLNKTESENN